MEVIKVYKNCDEYNDALNILTYRYDWKKRGKKYWNKRYSKNKSEYIGYLLSIEKKYVGFIGFLGDSKIIGLSVWYVDPEYRKYSISFISKVLENESKKTIINSSPNSTAFKIFKNLFGFEFENEYIGVPKKILNFTKIDNNHIYFGEKLNVCYDKNVSLITLVFLTLKYKKLCLALVKNINVLIFKKKINILFKNTSYNFPLSIKGDVYE